MGLNFTDFLDLERGVAISGKSKLKWKRNFYAFVIPHLKQICLECDKKKVCDQCETKPKTIYLDVR